MGVFGKILGGTIGWALGGPIGALVGASIGHVMDSKNQIQSNMHVRYSTGGGDFNMALLVLSAAVMKADGKVLKSELNYVKNFYNRQFKNPDFTKQQMLVLRDILQKEIPVRQVCEQIRVNMQHPMRLELLHYLFDISRSDGHVDKSEVEVIRKIAAYLGISEKDFESIKAMFYKDAASAYKILEVDPSATDDQVKKAYRKMAVKYHPDKVSQLSEEHIQHAKEKFQKVQEAYDTIKNERGIK